MLHDRFGYRPSRCAPEGSVSKPWQKLAGRGVVES
jgi:hypothetical protein